ncbi:cGMP-dependent protein kinase 1 isoform X1 [Hemibagrus wyckioides]|uniref:cGMP-dependent protein kinase 1 isoform X1 n=1 Tax=Hemibagrus wyckioides TaxID=337641 RepID=UPI00266CE77C|nr:cGMP-dependent protein kinase 1 isoform X1 [Hemibagrus wyckioides]
MGTLRDLQFALQLKIEELRQRDALIDELELELDAKDDLIRRLQGELDRLRVTLSCPGSATGQHRASSVRVKRRSVLTEPTNLDLNLILQNPPMSHSKSQDGSLSPRSQRVIETALRENEWLKYVGRELSDLVDCVYLTTVAQGARLIREGDEASQSFILEEGKLEVSRAGQKLHIIEAGTLFGELALLYNYTCTSTVTALVSSKLWVLERQVFERIMQRSSVLRITQCVDVLRSVPLLCALPEDDLIKISDVLQECHYRDRDYIVRHGVPGDTFFIVTSGQVEVLERRSVSEDSVCVSVLSRGDSFGDRALKGEVSRSLSIVATGDVTCLALNRESALRFIGATENGNNEPKARTADEGDGLCRVSLSDVQVLCHVGEGRYSHTQVVHLKNDTSRVFVLKVINKHALVSSGNRARVLTEKQILMDARCPFIVRLYCTFRDAKCLYMLKEACLGGDLWTLLRERGPFDESAVRFYTTCVLEALRFLHGQGIIHRDLKPENVLLDQKGYAKLAGFSSAKQLASLQRTWSFCGSAAYQAPEIILHKGHGVMADLWALGIFVYELLNGSPPFSGSDQLKICAAVLKGIDAVEFPEAISNPAADFIKQLCRENPTERLGQRNGVRDIQGHKWFEGFDWDAVCKGSHTPPILPHVQGVLDFSSSEDQTGSSPVDDSDWDKDF